MHIKWSFLLRVSSVNISKSAAKLTGKKQCQGLFLNNVAGLRPQGVEKGTLGANGLADLWNNTLKPLIFLHCLRKYHTPHFCF